MNSSKKSTDIARDLDRAAHAQMGQLTSGLSPVSMADAFSDWLIHLAISPGKCLELATKATDHWMRLNQQAVNCLQVNAEPCVEPLPQDRRFKSKHWQQWPYAMIYQSFLLNQEWWQCATTNVPGVAKHHENQVTFAVRQILDLYSPSNFVTTNPEVQQAALKSGGASLMKGVQHRMEDAVRMLTKQPMPGTENFRPGHEVAITPGKVVFRNDLIELIQYSPQTATVFAEPILMVPSWILKYYILDLSPHNSMVKFLLEKGHTVFMVSWRNPNASDRDVGLNDYLKTGVMAAIDTVSEIMPNRKIQAVGYCLGGTLLGMAAALMARSKDDRLKSLTLLAGALDFTDPGELGLFIDESQLAFLDSMMAKKGYLDGKQMSNTFTLLNSRDLLWSRREREYLMGERQSINDFAAWSLDVTRMPYRQHSEYLRGLYLNNDLAEGRYEVDGKPIAVSDIRVPVFALGTERDTVTPWPAVYKVLQLTPNVDVTFCLTTGGHNVGVISPPELNVKRGYRLRTLASADAYVDPDTWVATTPSAEGSWWPAWEDWLRVHAGRRGELPEIGSEKYTPLEDAPGRYVLIP